MIDHLTEYSLYYLIGLTILLVILLLIVVLRGKKKKPVVKKEEPQATDNSSSELEIILKSMEESEPIKRALSFEQEQEENAIISYQELLEAAKGKMGENVPKGEVDPLVEQALSEMEEDPIVETNDVVPSNSENSEQKTAEPVSEEPKKFKNSEFISPVFGKDNNTPTLDSNDEFLAALKNFRRSL